MEMNHVREKDKPKCKIPYKVFKEKYGYDPLIEISPFPKPIQLKEFLGDIQQCVTVVGKCIFDSNITFDLPITCNDLDYCCTNYNKTKVMNGFKRVLKAIRFF